MTQQLLSQQDTESFRQNVDAWIKQIRSEFSEVSCLGKIVEENAGNIQHNYELIYELKDEIASLKEEINALKMINLLHVKIMKAQLS